MVITSEAKVTYKNVCMYVGSAMNCWIWTPSFKINQPHDKGTTIRYLSISASFINWLKTFPSIFANILQTLQHFGHVPQNFCHACMNNFAYDCSLKFYYDCNLPSLWSKQKMSTLAHRVVSCNAVFLHSNVFCALDYIFSPFNDTRFS